MKLLRSLPLLFLLSGLVWGQALSPEVSAQIDQAARRSLQGGGPPGLVVGVARAGQPVFMRAYGLAQVQPKVAARPEMRFAIGSVSKQFTVTALLMLQEQGKLSLDDPVSRYFPQLTRAGEVKLRQLLSHTSGYSDYYPQDYLPESMRAPATPAQIMQGWAGRPLDFDPGTRWQYSNTNYVIAGAIAEQVSGMRLSDLLRQRIFEPLNMSSASTRPPDPAGYFRYAGGPPRVMDREGEGWLFATGDLSMSVEDLLKWDVAFLQHKLLRAESYQSMEREVQTADGVGSGYGLGLSVSRDQDRRVLEHGGEVAGFTCENLLLPEEGYAVAVLSNQMATPAPRALVGEISGLLSKVSDDGALGQHRRFLEQLRQGRVDERLLTPNAQAFFTAEARADIRRALQAAGPLRSFELARRFRRGGMVGRVYRALAGKKRLAVTTYSLPDGKLEQFLVIPLP